MELMSELVIVPDLFHEPFTLYTKHHK